MEASESDVLKVSPIHWQDMSFLCVIIQWRVGLSFYTHMQLQDLHPIKAEPTRGNISAIVNKDLTFSETSFLTLSYNNLSSRVYINEK